MKEVILEFIRSQEGSEITFERLFVKFRDHEFFTRNNEDEAGIRNYLRVRLEHLKSERMIKISDIGPGPYVLEIWYKGNLLPGLMTTL